MPVSSLAQSLVLPHSVIGASTHLAMSRRSTSPMPTGRTPGCLSNATRRLVISARMAAQGGELLLSHSTQAATSSRSSWDWRLKFKSQSSQARLSAPEGPAPSRSLEATCSTMPCSQSTGRGSGTRG